MPWGNVRIWANLKNKNNRIKRTHLRSKTSYFILSHFSWPLIQWYDACSRGLARLAYLMWVVETAAVVRAALIAVQSVYVECKRAHVCTARGTRPAHTRLKASLCLRLYPASDYGASVLIAHPDRTVRHNIYLVPGRKTLSVTFTTDQIKNSTLKVFTCWWWLPEATVLPS